MCIRILVQRHHLFGKTNTQKMVAKVKNLCTEEKVSFAYLCICVSGQRNHSLRLCPQAQFFSPKNTKTYLSCQENVPLEVCLA
jgi:hypothetical protein